MRHVRGPQRGVDLDKMPPIPPDTFKEQAENRVRLGLLVAELVKSQSLQAKPDQLRKQVEEFAQAYENPGELIRYYFSDRNRLAEVEAIVVEQNVVDWVLNTARVTDKALAFDELMAEDTVIEGATTLEAGKGPRTATADARERATKAEFQRRLQQRRGGGGGGQTT